MAERANLMIPGRKNLKFNRGALENAGLGEVAFFLKKAKQEVLYAAMALEHTDFSSFDEVTALQAKLVKLRDLVAEVSGDIEQAGIALAHEALRGRYANSDAIKAARERMASAATNAERLGIAEEISVLTEE
jgi:hypothetical protein